jgi:hypothetical protein
MPQIGTSTDPYGEDENANYNFFQQVFPEWNPQLTGEFANTDEGWAARDAANKGDYDSADAIYKKYAEDFGGGNALKPPMKLQEYPLMPSSEEGTDMEGYEGPPYDEAIYPTPTSSKKTGRLPEHELQGTTYDQEMQTSSHPKGDAEVPDYSDYSGVQTPEGNEAMAEAMKVPGISEQLGGDISYTMLRGLMETPEGQAALDVYKKTGDPALLVERFNNFNVQRDTIPELPQ